MGILKKINPIRRRLMHALTKNIGASQSEIHSSLNEIGEIKRVLICRPNHRLGNLLLTTPLLQEVIATFPDCKIDLFVKGGLAPILFQDYKNIDKIIELPKKPFSHLIKYFMGWASIKKRRYDLVINGDKNSSSGRLSTQFANAKFKVFGDVSEEIQLKHKDHKHIAKYPIYNLRSYLTKLGFQENTNPVPLLNLKLRPNEIAQGKITLEKIVDPRKKTISIFTFATGKKCYSESWWADFYERLKHEFKDYNIVEVLPVENVSQIGFKAPTFYSKDIREIGSVIANTDIFIGADSGIMHLASAALTPTVGLFSVTNENVYMPYGNKSVALNTNQTSIDEWIKTIHEILN